MTAAHPLSTKGRQTRQAIERAARILFAEKGFHGTTLTDITAAAGRSPASFYRYFEDKEDLLAALAQDFLAEVKSQGFGPSTDVDFFTAVVAAYWETFKPHIGVMVAVDQLAAIQPRFAAMQNEFRRFGIDVIAASIRRAQEHGHAASLNPDHTAVALALLFERFTSVCLRPGAAGPGSGIADDDAVATLSTIWKRTLYGGSEEP